MAGHDPTRRTLVRTALVAPLAAALWFRPAAGLAHLPPTPDCQDGDEPTPSQTAGPFFKPSSPRRTSLVEPGMGGTALVLAGMVLGTDCAAIPGALLDFWHADASGEYDLAGFRMRGHQHSDAAGRFRLETIVPGGYSGRTPHIHVRVQAPGGRILTTQLYFPGQRRNDGDGLFDERLLVNVRPDGRGRQAAFDFVLRT